MSDTTYNVFQHYGTAAERTAFTPSPAAGIKPIYIWYETDTSKTYLYHTAWVQIAGSGGVSAHASTHASAGSDPVTLAQSQITNLTTDLAGKASTTHAATHSSASSDPVTVTNLAGYPGGTSTFLRADGTFAAPSAAAVRKQVTLIIDGGSSVITTGVKGYLSLPVAGTWQKWRILSVDSAVTSGSIVIDVWKDVFASYAPTVADTITAAAKPTLSGATSAESSSLTGWTTSFSAGDIIGFNVDSVTSVKKISLTLEYE